jgi:hypothetical protein
MTAAIEYKIPGENEFWMTTQLIYKLITVIPVEEQDGGGGDVEEAGEAGEETDAGGPIQT